MLADIATGNTETADIFFLLALLAFVGFILLGFVAGVPARIVSAALGVGLAFLAFGWLVL